MNGQDGGPQQWGGDIDFNEWGSGDTGPLDGTRPPEDTGPRWEPSPPPRWPRRRIVVAVVGGLMAALIGVGGVMALTSAIGGEESVATDGAVEGTGGPGADVAVTPVELDWYAIDGTLGFTDRIVAAADGTFYALSTAPGQGFDVWPPVRAVYHSTDGENWDFAVLDDDIGTGDMAERHGVLYLIGTAPGFNDFGDGPVALISTSDDAGMTWDQNALPTIAASPGGLAQEWTEVSTSIAATDAGLVAVVQTNFWIDVWQLVPPDVLGEMTSINTVEGGVEVVDHSVFAELEEACAAAGGFGAGDLEDQPEPCRALESGDVEVAVVETFTWEELGIEDGQPVFSEVFFSADGSTWEAIESPFVPGRSLGGLWALGDGFLASQWSDTGPPHLWMSPDGRSWEAADGLPAFDWIAAAGSVGGDAVITGGVQGKPVIAWQGDDGSWLEIDPRAMLDPDQVAAGDAWMNASAVGPLGVVAMIERIDNVGFQPTIELVHGTGPDEWRAVPLEALSAQGFGYSDWAVVGADTVLIRYVESNGQRPLNLQLIGYPES